MRSCRTELRIVTIFLAVSALMNIALGYGLAIYLGRARLLREGSQSDEHAAEPLAASHSAPVPLPVEAAPAAPLAMAAPATTATPVNIPVEVATVAPIQAPAPPAEKLATSPASAEAAELESEVLAGIEEFRNQLAQMKAQPADAAAAEAPQTLATAGV